MYGCVWVCGCAHLVHGCMKARARWCMGCLLGATFIWVPDKSDQRGWSPRSAPHRIGQQECAVGSDGRSWCVGVCSVKFIWWVLFGASVKSVLGWSGGPMRVAGVGSDEIGPMGARRFAVPELRNLEKVVWTEGQATTGTAAQHPVIWARAPGIRETQNVDALVAWWRCRWRFCPGKTNGPVLFSPHPFRQNASRRPRRVRHAGTPGTGLTYFGPLIGWKAIFSTNSKEVYKPGSTPTAHCFPFFSNSNVVCI